MARQTRERERLEARSRQPPVPRPPSPTGWVGTVDAARVLGVTDGHVSWLVARGHLAGQHIGGRLWVRSQSVTDLVRFRAEEAECVSAADAAKTVGCGQNAILRAAQRGESRRLVGGHSLVTLRHEDSGAPSSAIQTRRSRKPFRPSRREQTRSDRGGRMPQGGEGGARRSRLLPHRQTNLSRCGGTATRSGNRGPLCATQDAYPRSRAGQRRCGIVPAPMPCSELCHECPSSSLPKGMNGHTLVKGQQGVFSVTALDPASAALPRAASSGNRPVSAIGAWTPLDLGGRVTVGPSRERQTRANPCRLRP
jgi:hypothetical protein